MLPALDSATDPQASARPSGQSPVASCQLPLSDRDRELLRLLRDPSGIDAIDPAEYAAWIERPEIQKAIAAQDDLDDRRQRLRDAARRAECLADNHLARERLRAVLEATMDLTDDAQRTDHRRAATALGRIARFTEHSRRPPAAPLTPRSDRGPQRLHPANRQSPVANRLRHLLTSPTSPPLQTSSHAFPGLDTTVAAFLAALGNPEGLHHAAQFVANHRIPEIGADNLMRWLESQTAPLRGAALRPGRTIHHARYDAAEQCIHAVHADGARSTWILDCVMERNTEDNTPARWAIAHLDPDTS